MSLILGIAEPINKVVYYVSDDTIFNASTLEKETEMIERILPLTGEMTLKFGVYPYVVSNASNEYYLIYAPNKSNKLYLSDGNSFSEIGNGPNQIDIGPLLTSQQIAIIDSNFEKIYLDTPNYESLVKYTQKSQGLEPNYEPGNTSALVHVPSSNYNNQDGNISPIPTPSQIVVSYDDAHLLKEIETLKQEIPKIESKLVETSNISAINEMKSSISQIYDILDALIRRIYELYPINQKCPFRIGNIEPKEISLSEYENMVKNSKVANAYFDALFQPYIGSHRKNNRILTVVGTDGKYYIVKCNYDPKTNKFSELIFGSS